MAGEGVLDCYTADESKEIANAKLLHTTLKAMTDESDIAENLGAGFYGRSKRDYIPTRNMKKRGNEDL